jgi:signal peptidase II
MQKLNSLRDIWRRNKVFLITAALVVIADQLSKLWIKFNIPKDESIFELGFFRLVHRQNTGSSFGLFHNQNLMLSIVAIVGSCLILYLVFFMYRRFSILNTRLARVSLGLILGGALGNLINRLSLGYVIDFIDFNYWPAFNIADSSAVIGSILLAYALIRNTRQSELSDGKKV